jgi:glycosyltransferase involved in cell wall biosynthesis
MPDISVIIPAYNSSADIAATVAAAKTMAGVTQVLVVDDGSQDDTAQLAQTAGGEVLILPCNQGKGGALRRGIGLATGDLLLFLDADLGESAAQAEALIGPVAQAQVAMTIADFVSSEAETPRDKGGFGLLLGLAAKGIQAVCGLEMKSPLSGQRCLSRQLAEQVGIADRFGVETSLTIEVARRGGRILEIPLPLKHARTGRSWAGFWHRGKQFRDVLGVLLGAFYGLGGPHLSAGHRLRRLVIWLATLAAFLAAVRFWQPRLFLAGLLSIGLAWVLIIPLFSLLCRRRKFLRLNYRKIFLPTAFGLLFVPVWLWSATLWLPLGRVNYSLAGLVLMLLWPLLGLLDDSRSGAGTRGFRGHIAALMRGRMTTGAAKLIFGGLVSLLAGWLIAEEKILPAIINGLLIALSTNFLNLLDLRPGRTLKGFLVLGTIAWLMNPQAGALLAPLFAAALVYSPLDLTERAMLGDTGSNILGAFAGLGLAAALPLPAKIVALALLIAVHIYAEIGSISKLIERVPPLRALDNLGRLPE